MHSTLTRLNHLDHPRSARLTIWAEAFTSAKRTRCFQPALTECFTQKYINRLFHVSTKKAFGGADRSHIVSPEHEKPLTVEILLQELGYEVLHLQRARAVADLHIDC